MSRQKLSEFKAKSLLIKNYEGVAILTDTSTQDIQRIDDETSYVIKVDQGIKKRGKQGLLKLSVNKSGVNEAINELATKGFSRFIAEPMVAHEDGEEKYLSIERTRDGMVFHYSDQGGVHVEDNAESVEEYSQADLPLPVDFVSKLVETMNAQHMSFLEINPLIVQGNDCILLDAAVLVDSAGEHEASWTATDTVEARTLTEAEDAVASLNDNSAAAFSFRVLNPNGGLWLLLSGGGASITIADEAANEQKADVIGNYGEYSGGPTAEETYLYTNEVIMQMSLSSAGRKAIVIAGGVANFTDVRKTFTGVIQSLKEHIDVLDAHNVKVYVRRGGPNEIEGLAMMKQFLESHNLFGSVRGSEAVLTDVIHEALEYIDA